LSGQNVDPATDTGSSLMNGIACMLLVMATIASSNELRLSVPT
jgi:hypothetical protein